MVSLCSSLTRLQYVPRRSWFAIHCWHQIIAANWKLGWDRTKLRSHRSSRQDKTAKNYACPVLKFPIADSLDLFPIQFTPPTWTRQQTLVLLESTARVFKYVTARFMALSQLYLGQTVPYVHSLTNVNLHHKAS